MTNEPEGPQHPVHYAGVLIVSRAPAIAGLAARVDALPGVEVHHLYPDRARMVAVLETATIAEQLETLARIRALPGVVLAEPAYHFVDDPVENER